MFGDVAIKLLKCMGHSGTVPSAILAEDIPEAVEKLRSTLREIAVETANESSSSTRSDGDSAEKPPVSLEQRAFPLIELLQAAAEAGAPVTWGQ